MAETGRRPYATFDVATFGYPDERLRPPASLGTREKRVFVDLISRTPAGQFRQSDMPLICRWCEATVLAERAAAELAAGSPVTPAGTISPWVSIHERATKSLVALALRLRLSPQGRADKAPKSLPARTNFYDRMSFEEGTTDADSAERKPD